MPVAGVSEWLEESRSLKRRLAAVEREVATAYNTRGDLKSEMDGFGEERRRDDIARAEKLSEMQGCLKARQFMLAKIRSRVQALAAGRDVASDLEDLVTAAEEETQRFKASMRAEYSDLAATGRMLTVELDALARKFEGWNEEPPVARPAPAHGSALSDRWPAAAAVAAATASNITGKLDALISQEGGPTGGWPQHEHDTFLRLWTQLKPAAPPASARPSSPEDAPPLPPPPPPKLDDKRKRALLHRAAAALPERDSEEVALHAAWYERYIGYLAERRRLVLGWKRSREEARKAEASAAADSAAAGAPARQSAGVSAVDKAAAEGRPAERMEAAAARVEAMRLEREEKAKALEAWRAERQAKAEVERRQKAEADEEASLQLQEERRRRRQARERLAAYRLEREKEEQRRLDAQRMLERAGRRYSQADRQACVDRDLDSARRRREELQRRKSETGDRERLLRAAAAAAAAAAAGSVAGKAPGQQIGGAWGAADVDPDRPLRPTVASRVRELSPEELDRRDDARARRPAHQSVVANSARDLRFCKRAVPTWRKGLVGC